jgi:hypothetical protein
MQVDQDTWLLIEDQYGGAVFSRVLKPGDVYYVPQSKTLWMTTGNSNGLTMLIDGKPIPKLGGNSKVLRGVLLDPDRLKQGQIVTVSE